MLIKSRVVAGNRRVGEQWVADIQPFVFPRTQLTSPLDEIARIKTKIEAKIGEATNIKLGSGGIRDIEFSVQALQLLNGGANAGIRQRSTVAAIRSLVDSHHLKKHEGKDLELAYQFLRRVEDRLQLLHGLQKHSLPDSAEERTILARQLGYRSARDFSVDLKKHQSKIRAGYLSVFGGSKAGMGGAQEIHSDRCFSPEHCPSMALQRPLWQENEYWRLLHFFRTCVSPVRFAPCCG